MGVEKMTDGALNTHKKTDRCGQSFACRNDCVRHALRQLLTLQSEPTSIPTPTLTPRARIEGQPRVRFVDQQIDAQWGVKLNIYSFVHLRLPLLQCTRQ